MPKLKKVEETLLRSDNQSSTEEETDIKNQSITTCQQETDSTNIEANYSNDEIDLENTQRPLSGAFLVSLSKKRESLHWNLG